MDLTDEHDPHQGTDRETLRHLVYVVAGLLLLTFGIMGVVALVV